MGAADTSSVVTADEVDDTSTGDGASRARGTADSPFTRFGVLHSKCGGPPRVPQPHGSATGSARQDPPSEGVRPLGRLLIGLTRGRRRSWLNGGNRLNDLVFFADSGRGQKPPAQRQIAPAASLGRLYTELKAGLVGLLQAQIHELKGDL